MWSTISRIENSKHPKFTLQECSKLIWYLGSIWRLVCLAFFGAFAAGAIYEAYGLQITSFIQTAVPAVKVRLGLLPFLSSYFLSLCV